jgi:methionyl-tRNA synthetase
LQLRVDLGFEERTIISGIAEYYKPEEILGKKVSVVVNLAPRKMRGVFSEGMILMAEDAATGDLAFCATSQNLPNGAVIK